jgi:hypothetical protein
VTDAAPYDAWGRATLALSLLAVDPEGLRGLWLRARSGPSATASWPPRRAPPAPPEDPPGIADDQLFGGVDLSATLSSGHLVRSRGLLAEPSALVLAMAERCPPGLAVRLGQTLDARTHCLVALDEGAEPDETLPPALSERLAFFVALDDVPLAASDFATLDHDRSRPPAPGSRPSPSPRTGRGAGPRRRPMRHREPPRPPSRDGGGEGLGGALRPDQCLRERPRTRRRARLFA